MFFLWCFGQQLRVVQEIEQSEPNEISLANKASKISLMGLRARANDSDKSMTVRAKCVEELLTTEVDYGKLLRNVIEVMFKGIYFRSVELFA